MNTYEAKMFKNTFESEYNFLSAFMRNVYRHGNNIALIDVHSRKQFTYLQINKTINQTARSLKACGVKKHSVVMVALRNCPEFAYTYVAPRKLNGIFVPINFKLTPSEIAGLIDLNKPKVFIYSGCCAENVAEAEKLCKFKPKKFVLADNLEDVSLPKNHVTFDDFIKNQSDEELESLYKSHIYNEVLRLCTSGTTSFCKMVPINEINEVLSCHDVIMHFPLNSNDKTLNLTPWFHRGGCHSVGIGPTFYVGGTCICMEKFSPQKTIELIDNYKISYVVGAPANLELVCHEQERYKFDLSSLKGVIAMGSPLSKDECIRIQNIISKNVSNGYGTTETFWNTLLSGDDVLEHAGSIGKACIDDEVRVVQIYENRKAECDEVVPKDGITQGEIIVKCPGKTTYSYYKNKQTSKRKFYKGWMYTGDTATWNEKEIITIVGRRDDMFVVSGENIYPNQIEQIIRKHTKVKECVVTCVPDKLRGNAIVAYIVPKDKSLTVEEMVKYCSCSKNLSKYKNPRYYCIVDEIPNTAKTPTGKIKHVLMKIIAKNDLLLGKLRKS